MNDQMIDNSDAQDERSQLDVLNDLDIAMLRKAAKVLNIQAQRDWDKGDFVAAIKAKQEQKTAPDVVFDNALGPKPGHARIVLHRDPTPGHKNSPVQCGVNGRLLHIPRGIEVDIPIPHMRALENAKSTQVRQQQGSTRENPSGIYKDEEHMSYPFQLISITPGGKFDNSTDSRTTQAIAAQKFADVFGRYPTGGELAKWNDAKINNQAK